MSLKFKKIESGDIFTRDFSPLVKNNEITFPTSEEIAVIYGPNGTGKTSLIKVLGDTPGTKLEFSLEETEYQNGSNVFHIINDQNNRNRFDSNVKYLISYSVIRACGTIERVMKSILFNRISKGINAEAMNYVK